MTDANHMHLLYKQFVSFSLQRPFNSPSYWVHLKLNISGIVKWKRLVLDLRHNKAYTGEIEKLRRDNSNLVLYTALKNTAAKGTRWEIIFTCSQIRLSQWHIRLTVLLWKTILDCWKNLGSSNFQVSKFN